MSILIDASQRNTYDDDHKQYAYSRATGERIEPGTPLQGSRGETWMFKGVGRYAYGNSSGRVSVSAACAGASGYGYCVHAHHHNGIVQREFFPSVFGLYLGLADGTEV